MQSLLFHIVRVDLFDRILIFTDDDGRLVDIEQQIALIDIKVLKGVFLYGKIDPWIRDAFIVYEFHVDDSSSI